MSWIGGFIIGVLVGVAAVMVFGVALVFIAKGESEDEW